MTQLYIDNQLVALKEGTSFKLTRQNPMFSSEGDYTFDVTLPLDGCARNQIIFKALHRPEMSRSSALKTQRKYSLLADGLQISGTYVVTSVTQQDIKIQLLGGRSRFNSAMLDADGNDLYIDELSLGKAWDTMWKAHFLSQEETMEGVIDYFILPAYTPGLWDQASSDIANGADCVAFPIYSAEDGDFANPRALNQFYLNSNYTAANVKDGVAKNTSVFNVWNVPFEGGTYSPPSASGGTGVSIRKTIVLAPQPYMCHIVERIVSALGFAVKRNAIRETEWMRNVFIANCRGTLDLHKLLPHWTAKQFFQEVERFFGVMVQIDGTDVYIVSKAEYYKSQGTIHFLEQVVDEFTADVDSSETEEKDLTSANVGYAFTDIAKMLLVPDEVWAAATVKEFSSYSDIIDYASTIDTSADGSWQSEIYKDKSTKKTYAWMLQDEANNIMQIDQMANLYRHSGRDLDVELHIVPVQMDWQDMERRTFINASDTSSKYKYAETLTDLREVVMLTGDTRIVTGYDNYNVSSALAESSNDQTSTNKRDVMEVAMNMGIELNLPYTDKYLNSEELLPTVKPVGIPYTVDNDGHYSLYQRFANYLHLVLTAGKDNESVRANLEAYSKVESRVETQFNFTDRGQFSPTDIYIIRGRRYLCEKLELTITEDGKDPLIRGYFFEMG